jgi:hypothetical protein
MKPALRIVTPETTERVFGSREFIGLTRRAGMNGPRRFEPTKKDAGDVVI